MKHGCPGGKEPQFFACSAYISDLVALWFWQVRRGPFSLAIAGCGRERERQAPETLS